LLVGVNRNRLPTSFLASHAHRHARTHTHFGPRFAGEEEEEEEETEGVKGILSFFFPVRCITKKKKLFLFKL